MSRCGNEELDTDLIFEQLDKLYQTTKSLFWGSFGNDANEVIEQLALARRMVQELDEFKEVLVNMSTSSIYCLIIQEFDFEEQVQELEDKADEFLLLIETFDDAVSNLQFDNFADLESQVDVLFDSFDDRKNELTDIIKTKSKVIFEPLIYMGASSEQIDNALEDVEFSLDIKEYISSVYNNVLDQTILELSD